MIYAIVDLNSGVSKTTTAAFNSRGRKAFAVDLDTQHDPIYRPGVSRKYAGEK